ncbi:hypothetical protein AQS8620_00255 [Aquimixticola soesokkakensis]|uniref:Thioesterase superfamily protein n=1 Tax=Aquimixticola soesokkakensis TaxID=1519096 RepID=A0A1Y5RDN6_9RHOB|nr:acyl-CoA thioesterase [Aquimixticola soesokkakensis]SLN14992.1 hypothetical protein AQS8620_00255 [Aquimixticola soesokkakensis]
MYPFIRIFWHLRRARSQPKTGLLDALVSHHYCMPWDLDLWRELNNGRTLTLYDLGRVPMLVTTGMADICRAKRWGMTVAGASVRYRKRITMFERLQMRSRAVGWDEKFIYVEQSMWTAQGECANHVLLRMALVSKAGIVPPVDMLNALGAAEVSPVLPDYVQNWIAADATRPWPPMQDQAVSPLP